MSPGTGNGGIWWVIVLTRCTCKWPKSSTKMFIIALSLIAIPSPKLAILMSNYRDERLDKWWYIINTKEYYATIKVVNMILCLWMKCLCYISEKQVNYAMIMSVSTQRLGGKRQNENELKVIEFWTIYFPSSKIILRDF